MSLSWTPEQQEMRSAARRFLEQHSPLSSVRATMTTDGGTDDSLWRQLSQEMGWTGLCIPEEYCGLGLPWMWMVALQEELGRSLACVPFFSSICLAAPLIQALGTEDQKARWLSPLASGDSRATVILGEGRGAWLPEAAPTTWAKEGDEYRLEGGASLVLDGHTADVLLAVARPHSDNEENQLSVFVVESNRDGISIIPQSTMDATRKAAKIHLSGVRVPAFHRLGGDSPATEGLHHSLSLASMALAAEQVGVAERCMEMAVEYAKVRVQFGRPIGSFQAVKHMCADMLLQVESSRSAALAAGYAADESPGEFILLAALAKAWCGEAVFRTAADMLQVHGGIGFTWEHDAHLYFKRARASESLLGDPAFHRERIAEKIL